MAKWNQIVITDAGYQLSAQTLAGKRIQYTHAQTTDKDMSAMTSDQLKAVTKLDDVVQDLSIGIVTVQDDHTVNVPVTVANQDLAADYLLSAMAIYAKPVDPTDGDEILYGIATAVTPDLIPKQDGTTVVGTNFKLKLHVGRADNVAIIITPDGSVSNDELMGILKNYLTQDDLNKALPETIIDSSKPADFKESVTLEKGAVDGAGNAIATTKNLADGDAETLTSAKDYADAANKSKLSIDDQLGGTNLLLNSKFDNGMNHWNNWGDSAGGTVELIAGTSNWDNRATTLLHVKKPNSSAYLGVAQVKVSVAPNSQYTLSLYRTGQGPIFMQSGSGDTDPYQHTVIPQGSGEVTFTFTTGATRTTNIYVGVGDGDTGDIYISLIKLERGATHSDWSPAPEDKADASEVAPLTVGAIHDGADMDKEFTTGSYFSKDAVIHGPGFPNGDVMLTWVVSAVTSNTDEATAYVQMVYDQPGDTAVRNFVSGAGWGPWKHMVQDNGDGTVTSDGRIFTIADTDHTVPVSDAGVAGPANFAASTLKVDGLEVLGAKVFSDTDDYKTFAAAHPSAITIVTHNTTS